MQMVSAEVVEFIDIVNILRAGAGENIALRPNGHFKQVPHLPFLISRYPRSPLGSTRSFHGSANALPLGLDAEESIAAGARPAAPISTFPVPLQHRAMVGVDRPLTR